MHETVTRFAILIIYSCLFIEQISTLNYELVEGYPAHVQVYRSGSSLAKPSSHHHDIDGVQNDEPHKPHRRLKVRHSGDSPKKLRTCLRCPLEIKAVAPEGFDGILVEPPAPRACQTNLPFNPDLYKIETLFGPELHFLLPEGKHKIFARIRNIETGLIVKTCPLRYDVTVRRCIGLPRIKSKYLRMSCTAGRIFGSKCAFQCKNPRAQLSHRHPIVCNETLQWEGTAPTCTDGAIDYKVQFDSKSMDDRGFCEPPPSPANGRYVCDSENEIVEMNQAKHGQSKFKSGTICKVQCNETYSIPIHLSSMASITCKNGHWNVNDIDFCYKQQSKKRRHNSPNGSKQHSHPHPQIHKRNSNRIIRT